VFHKDGKKGGAKTARGSKNKSATKRDKTQNGARSHRGNAPVAAQSIKEQELRAQEKILEQVQLRPTESQRRYRDVNLMDIDPNAKNNQEDEMLLRYPVSNLSTLDKERQKKTIAYKRIDKLLNKIEDPINLKGQPQAGRAGRFDKEYQRSMLEIDNKYDSVSGMDRLEFLRNQFRADINQITDNLV